MSELKQEHGTIRAYITGFILSLIFTFIPYYLVVNQVITGTALLATILSFGVLQMLVQVIFFLHLGRSPRPNWQIVFFIFTIATILIVVAGSVVITRNLKYNMQPSDQLKKIVNDEGIYQIGGEKTGACQGQHDNHQVMLMNDIVSPVVTEAKQCDTLTFINHDIEPKEITFGAYPNQTTYAGEDVYTIRNGRNKTITLSEPGTYNFYDQSKPETAGQFMVTQ